MNRSFYFGDSKSGTLLNSEETHGKVEDAMITQIPFKNTMIVLMDHPASVTVYQHVSIEVLSGSVSVFGYEIKQTSIPLTVFSSERTGLIEIKTETFDRIWKKKADASNLEQELYNITEDRDIATNILKNFGNYTVAIVVKSCVFPPNLRYLEFYYPYALEFDLYKWSSKDFYYVPRSKGTPVEFDLEVEKIASEINIFVRGAKLTDAPAPRILIYGPKKTGKSSLLRFLINKILSIYVVAYYLDTDPGQTEFTPPGLVSLTKVTKPVMGPSFTHLRKPISMIFTGGISAESSPDMYNKSVCKLMELYTNKFSDDPLFINTMGWIEGLGLHCLKSVISAVKPTILIELVNEDEISMLDCRNYLPDDGQYFQIRRTFASNSHLSPQEMRNMTLLSYLGKCQTPFQGSVFLNDVKPYCVSWDKIAVYMFGKKVPPYRMVESINASIVALCIVPESAILESDIPQLPKTLEEEPDNECVGYGLVRAIDEKEHTLYIISPLSLKEIQKVNAIIKGNVMIPDDVFLNQPLYKVPLPFTNVRDIYPSRIDEEMADSSIMTLKSTTDVESPTQNSTRAECYRKKICKRHRRPMRK